MYKIIIISLLIVFITSCSKIEKEFYESGIIKKEYTLKDGKIDGEYKEFYKNGALRIVHQYKDGKKIDSSFYFYKNIDKVKFTRYWYSDKKIKEISYNKNGRIKNEGFLSKSLLRKGKWRLYNAEGKLESINQYKIINKKQYLNQIWNLNEDGDTLINSGNFYDIRIAKDTIKTGSFLKLAVYLDVPLFKDKDSEMLVCVPNKENVNFNKDFSNDDKIKLDTFYNLTKDVINQQWFSGGDFKKIVVFSKYFNKSGDRLLRGYIVEYYNQAPIDKDSIIREERKMYFEIPFYVKDNVD